MALKERGGMTVYGMKQIVSTLFLRLCQQLEAQDVLMSGFRNMPPAGTDREVRSAGLMRVMLC